MADRSTDLPAKLYYALSPAIAQELRRINLHASEWRLWSFLVTLEPFGDRYAEMPDLIIILSECQISKATFYRALAKFEEHGLFDTQPLKIAFRNLRGRGIVSPMRQPDSCMRNSDSPVRMPNSPTRLSSEENFSDPFQGNGSSKSSNVPITDQTFKTKQIGASTADEDKQGLDLVHPQDPLLEKISAAGLNPNKTIQQAIATLQRHHKPSEVSHAVDNALSALQEQQQKGTVRNPGGFFVAAIKRNFTANEAKRNARDKHTTNPFRASPPQAFDEIAISQQIDTYLIDGHKDWAIAKLKQLYESQPDQTRELLSIRRDWKIKLTEIKQP
ncbi:MAG: hypothetical protein SFY66_18470 [Oculatellaceae cyanobacterium bins.114]|nr:hypothetical protein [Oculatellaceae cyanobacterium bins.114]